MDSKIYIYERLIQGHIEKEDLDLSNMPEWPKCDISKKNQAQRLLGIVTRCESRENYVFILTNQFGINDSKTPSQPAQLYPDKKQWKDSVPLEEGMWITFVFQRQRKSTNALFL